ncbi:hypothetical protein [uncultured Massilia sp.]|uniref:hypothetical protein n=1 Tax=uncultured Massilia sp. TaxID=169973 RepID=UPI0025DC106B|nr:hypothetical protein [uncultured Massilia sp.]
MTTSLKRILLLASLAAAGAAQAGSPDGLSLAAVGNASGAPYAGAVKQFFADHKAQKVADCNDYMLDIANLYVANLPPQLTGDLAVGAVNDKAKRKRLAALLTGYRDATLTHGFDGALAYEVREGKLRLYGISGDPGEKVLVSTLTPAEAADQRKFNVAACKAVAGLGVLAAP